MKDTHKQGNVDSLVAILKTSENMSRPHLENILNKLSAQNLRTLEHHVREYGQRVAKATQVAQVTVHPHTSPTQTPEPNVSIRAVLLCNIEGKHQTLATKGETIFVTPTKLSNGKLLAFTTDEETSFSVSPEQYEEAKLPPTHLEIKIVLYDCTATHYTADVYTKNGKDEETRQFCGKGHTNAQAAIEEATAYINRSAVLQLV
jgi:hypothetical protein